MEKVDNFRTLIGAPDVEKFNIVLLGGLLGSLFSFLQFLSCPLLGSFSDIYGRKRVLILCMVRISCMLYIVCLYTHTRKCWWLDRMCSH